MEDVYEISTTIQGVETNPHLIDYFTHEIVAVVTFSTAINGHEG